MNVLITGITGFLGPYLQSEFAKDPLTIVHGVARGAEAYYSRDLTDPAAVKDLMERSSPDLVIHAAAMTNVDQCQERPKEAWAANVLATRNIVQHMPLRGRLVYISSDAVYSGTGPHSVGGHTENPLNVYGMTKYMGEFEAAKFPNHLIVRTTMYGLSRSRKKSSSLVNFLIDSFTSGKPLTIFTDILFSPLHAETLASWIKRRAATTTTGIINLGSKNGISKSKFALLIAAHAGFSVKNVTPGLSTSVPGRVQRSLDTRLACPDLDVPDVESDMLHMCKVIKSCRVT